MVLTYESLIRLVEVGLTVIATILVILALYYIRSFKRREKWEQRLIILALLFIVHELSFFLEERFISQLTEMLFIIGLLYALAYVFTFEKKMKDIEEQRKEVLKGLEEIRDLKGLREKLKK